MKALITGGGGRIGRAAAEHLIESSWDVRVIDLMPEIDLPGAEYWQCDITDYDAVRDAVRGCDAIVHMAAIVSPNLAPAPKIFQVNVSGTFHIFEAAAEEGIRRIVQASSINAIGCAYNRVDINPPYFPLDENMPRLPTDAYSFSKQSIEDIGEYYWRRTGISSVALRFPGVYLSNPNNFGAKISERAERDIALLDELAALSPDACRERLAETRAEVLKFRAEGNMERSLSKEDQRWKHDNPLFHLYSSSRFNYWALLHINDTAQSIEKGLTADYEGSHPLFINDTHNWLGYDTETLLRIFFPDVTKRTRPIKGSEALVSIDKARELIGFEPKISRGGIA